MEPLDSWKRSSIVRILNLPASRSSSRFLQNANPVGMSQMRRTFEHRPSTGAIVLLRSLPLFQQVPEVTLEKIAEVVKPARYGPGEPIVRLNFEGDGLYIIWKGEAKVISPPSEYPGGHTESVLRCGDYFGSATTRPVKHKYTVDVVAITEVFCLVLTHESADLLSASSVWDWDSWNTSGEGPSKMERILRLETIEVDIFRTYAPVAHRSLSGNYYGGQFVCEALLAATKLFLQQQMAVVYRVQRTREGQSFSTRHVEALQKGKVVFVLYASFKRQEEGFEHSTLMPSVPGPDELEPMEQRYDTFITDPRLPRSQKGKYAGVKMPLHPIELRYVDASDKFQPGTLAPRQHVWMRSREKLPDGEALHRCVGAYATDLSLLETSLRPHPDPSRVQMLSLDHTVWFHRSFKADEWLLFVCESPAATDGRGLSLGRVYTQDGMLVMSVAQEGLLRKMENKVKKVAKL